MMKWAARFFLGALLLGMLMAWLWPEAGMQPVIDRALEQPGFPSFLGRDSLGRDLLFRILDGAHASVLLGFGGSLMATLIGVFYGSLSAGLPRWLDSFLMRLCEILMALPSMMLMAIVALMMKTKFPEANLMILFVTISACTWMPTARIARNLIVLEKQKEYVEAAFAIGATPVRLFLKHILPNVASPLLVYWSLQVPSALLAEGLLSFLGFGIKSPSVSWGALLQEGWKTLASFPHLLLGPALFLFLTILSMNILLESFRLKLEPKLRWMQFRNPSQ